MRRISKKKQPKNQLTIDFGCPIPTYDSYTGSPFQRVKSEMLKRRERLALRRKPMQYEKLQNSLQQKLKQKTYDNNEQRDQLVMLEKCKNYFQQRRNHSYAASPKQSLMKSGRRPRTSVVTEGHSVFLQQLKRVMNDCSNEHREEQEIKQNMSLFTYYCKMMDRRLENFKDKIDKKERMI